MDLVNYVHKVSIQYAGIHVMLAHNKSAQTDARPARG